MFVSSLYYPEDNYKYSSLYVTYCLIVNNLIIIFFSYFNIIFYRISFLHFRLTVNLTFLSNNKFRIQSSKIS